MAIPVGALAKAVGVAAPVLLDILREHSNARDRQKLDEGAVLNVVVETPDSIDASPETDGEMQPTRKLLGRIPRAESQRRVIVVSSPAFTELPPEVDSHGVTLIAAPARAPRASLDAGLYRRGLLEPGAILIQSPLDANVYQPLKEAALTFALDKLLLYDRVAGLLGATKFSVE